MLSFDNLLTCNLYVFSSPFSALTTIFNVLSPIFKLTVPVPLFICALSVSSTTAPTNKLVVSLDTFGKVYSKVFLLKLVTVLLFTVKLLKLLLLDGEVLVTVIVYVLLVHVFPGTLAYLESQFSAFTTMLCVFVVVP